MAPRRKPQDAQQQSADPSVFDRAHLARYTMQSEELEREVLGLFLAQMPAMLQMIATATDAAEWKLAAHTLKGSAAAIGAGQIQEFATRLEIAGIDLDVKVRQELLAGLEAAVQQFETLIRRIY